MFISFLLLWLLGIGILLYLNVKKDISLWWFVYFNLVILMALSMYYASVSLWALTLLYAGLSCLGISAIQKIWLSKPMFYLMRKRMPSISETEQVVLKAGNLWWDKEIFSGKVDWKMLKQLAYYQMTEEEQTFYDIQVNELCSMVNNYEVRRKGNLPLKAWNYINKHKFLGIVIPKQYGGLGFSHSAHAKIIIRLASRCSALGVTVMVPNSLAPGELLVNYATEEQKHKYLPTLSAGKDILCFALTSTVAGSDAGSIIDNGIICKRTIAGQEVLGVLLNWEKRYITLSPIATLLILAFKTYDPDNLLPADHPLKGQRDLGISCALISCSTEGVSIGERHNPLGVGFMNGATRGKDVFISLDDIVGGVSMLGKGWLMLMECLSVGRSISLPGSSSATCQMSLLVSSAYAYSRQQFGVEVARFEGIAEKIASMVIHAYRTKANSFVTTSVLDAHIKPSVISAIVKYRNTEMARQSILHAQDIHAGKGIIAGPKNYLIDGFLSMPFGITVEGANILSRTFMVFGQGLTRCHPFVYAELEALHASDQKMGLERFHTLFRQHMASTIKGYWRLLLCNQGIIRREFGDQVTATWYAQIERASMQFATTVDIALLLLQSKLKFKEMLSGQFADSLSAIYEATCAVCYFEYIRKQSNQADEKLTFVLHCVMKSLMLEHRKSLYEVIANLPFHRYIKSFLHRWIIGKYQGDTISHQEKVKLTQFCQDIDWVHAQLAPDCYVSEDVDDSINEMIRASKANLALALIRTKIKQHKTPYEPYESFENYTQRLMKNNVLSPQEVKQWNEARTLIFKAVSVDSSAKGARLHHI